MADNKQNKELQEQINNLREQEISLTQELVSLRNTLASISEKDVKNLQKIKSLQEKIIELENKSQKVSNQIIDVQGRILSTQQEIVESREDEREILDDLVSDDKVREALAGKQLKIYNQIDDTYDSTVDLSKKLLSNQKLSEDSQNRIRAISQSTSLEQSAFNALLVDSTKNREKILEVIKSSAGAGSDILNLEKKIADAQVSAAKGKVQIIDLTDEQARLEEINNQLKQKSNILSDEAKAVLEEKAKLLEDSINLAEKQNKISKEAVTTYETMGNAMSGVFDGVESAISKVPGGEALMKLFGFDEMKEKIENGMGGALQNVMNSFKSGGLVEGMKSLPGAAMQFGKALLAGPQVAIFGVIAAVGMLIDLFMDLDSGVSEVQKELGGTKKEALAAHEAAHDMAKEMNLVGVNSKEVVKGMATVSEIMGGIDVKNMMQAPGMKEMVKDATLLSEKFGMSKEEIENVHTLSTLSGKSMGALAGEAIQVAGGVMKTKDAVKLLGGISKDVAVAFKGGTKELIAAAAKAKLLGTDLKKVKDIGMGMLDIESSLEKEMEARAILGRDINLDKAREAALNGDVATLQDELLTQAGSLKEFQEGGPLKQKALADAMGMTVEEMTTMLTKAEEMNKLGLDKQLQEKLANATAEERAAIYKNQAATLQGEARDLALRKAAEEESASTAEKFGDIMTKIKETAMKLVAPILDVVHGLMDGIAQGGGLMDIFDGVFSILKPIMDVIMGIGKVLLQNVLFPFKLVWAIIQPIFDAVKDIFSIFSSGTDSVGGMAGILEKVSGIFKTIQDVILGISGVLISYIITPTKMWLMAIITPLWDAFKGVYGTFVEIYDTISKAFEPLFKAKDGAEQTSSIVDTIKKAFEYIGPVISFIGGIIAKVLIKPLETLAGIISAVVKIFTGDFEGGLKTLGDTMFNFFLGIPKMILMGIGGAIDAIFGTNLKESIGGFFDWIQKAFGFVYSLIEPIFKYVMKIGGILIDYLLQPFKSIWGVIEGIGKLFTGDLQGGLELIGQAIADFFMAPVNLVMGLFDAFVGLFKGIGDKIKAAVKDLLPGWALDLLGLGGEEEKAAEETKSSAGGGAKTEVPKMAAGGTVEKGGLAMVGENGPEVVSLPSGATVASTGASDQTSSILEALGIPTGASDAKAEKQGGRGGVISTVAEGIGGLFGSVVGGAVGAISGGGGGTNMANVEKKLDTLITLFTQAASQPTVIKFGEKTVEEIKGQLNFKKAYQVGTDNTYGRAVEG
jgi:hypothetical protein